MTQYIVMVGSPVGGFQVVGPFNSQAEANLWATHTIAPSGEYDYPHWVMPLMTTENYIRPPEEAC